MRVSKQLEIEDLYEEEFSKMVLGLLIITDTFTELVEKLKVIDKNAKSATKI